MDPLSFIFILKTAAQRSPPWLVKTKKMLDLHYTRTIVLNVEVENWKSHRKENPCTTTPRHSALSSGVFSSSRGLCFFLSTKVECPWGRRAHVFLMWLSPCEGHLCDPHLPQMLFRCHDEAYSPLPPPHTTPANFSSPENILPKSQRGKRSVESTCKKSRATF